ncbi:hypothetical protein BJY52DRAFT_1188514 [Lactarius psammicola]|nr:hypothetical protein BJY52DRAFT_1188514 [Lactarius psammicola]
MSNTERDAHDPADGSLYIDKIVVAQQSLQEFINALSPGAYSSITKVNFKILDNVVLKPFGIYGSKEEIVRFLLEIKAVDDSTAQKLLVPRNGQAAEPVLRSGLYIVRSFLSTSEEQAYVVYWPEDTTWDDRAASPVQRNRVTFMRYLSKLCDQLICLLSSEHSRVIIWSEDDDGTDKEGDDDDSDGASTDSEKGDSSRVYHFKVAKTKDQEENVVIRGGFMMSSPLIINQAPPPGVDTDPRAFCPALLHGEKVQGFMTTTFTADQIRLRLGKEVVLCLSEKFDSASLKPLITALGLRTRFPKEYEAWERSKNEIERRFQQVVSQRKAEIHAKIEQDFEGITGQSTEGCHQRVVKDISVSIDYPFERYPIITEDRSLRPEGFFPKSSSAEPTDPKGGPNNAENSLRDLFLLYPRIEQTLWGNIRGADFGKYLRASEFQFKKKRMMFLQLLNSDSQDGKGLSADLTRSVADAVLGQQDERSALAALETFGKDDKGIFSWLPNLFRSSRGKEGLWESASRRALSVSDSQFLSELETIPVDHYLHEAAIDAEGTAYTLLTKQIDTLVSGISRQILLTQKKECDKQVQREVDAEEAGEVQILWSKFVHQVKDVSTQRSTSRTIVYLDHFKVRRSSFSRDTYYISGRQEYLREDEIEYRIHLLRLRADESQKVQLDPSYVPTPILEKRLTHSFRVSSSTVVKYVHLLDGGRILLGLVDPHGNIVIYVESLSRIDAAIQGRSFARLFHRDKIGETCLFSLDESKRILAVYSSARMQLHIFAFEDERGSLRGMGSAIDLLPFYSNGVSIVHAAFVHGREEILFVDSSAQARIFSLTMLQPKPASLQLPQVPRAIYSSPDGSCVLVVQEKEGVSSVTAYHWATFASTDGISITLPDFPVDLDAALLTSIVNRNNVHLIGLDVTAQTCRSVVLDITCKATEFSFQQQRSKASTSNGKETVHNCLIDCHSDVWTRFPVVAAVKRRTVTSSSERQQRTLTFVTDDDQRPFSLYFSEMIRSFTKTSRKPTGDVLKGITVSARTFTSFARAFLSSPEWPVSRFRAGEWLADLLCLIPIHIAVTHENRFVPLKDGVSSAQLEISLLGAEVNRIVDSLSIGWYESIFQSYWASKPVKVVSSMGEQSVGKSFTLNHLVDTSFAGSAMRTTEGVWLSVSPTDDALIVALDFEGVHSLERSAQEDTLLVLFNTAISNLVLFRNNFALSRDITGLFQSFQSSSSILDPASNPSLFQSTLLVIIKDVIDSDEAEVTKEFSLKFQKIVEDEQDSNFITRLHAGNLKIIPWPVIESKEFYQLFRKVKKALDQQPTSHNTAGEFLLTLKTLMAKLKANDWGAMSQTMAMHRANSLLAILPNALETGFSEIDPEPVPLKNFDADVVVEAEDTEACFILTGTDTPVIDHEHRLVTLRESWDRTNQRQHVDDSTWHSDLAQYLTHLVDLRVAHVESWLESNIYGPASNCVDRSVVPATWFAYEVVVCTETTTTARRTTNVSMTVLSVNGTLSLHNPAAKLLAMQEITSLIYAESRASTPENEAVWRNSYAPLSLSQPSTKAITNAQLRSICVAKKKHPCGSVCSAGICEIQTKPQAIEATFTGKHGSFQYTKYTQAAKRLPCAKVIKPGEVEHPGSHIHSNDERPFHYCSSRCGNCDYLCTLPSGHPQQEHETSHGSMSQTRWVIDGSDDTSVELEGRKFASNDEVVRCCAIWCASRWEDMCTSTFAVVPIPIIPKPSTSPRKYLQTPIKLKTGLRTHSTGAEWVSKIRTLEKIRQFSQNVFLALITTYEGREHTTEGGGASAQPSGCTLPIFHAPMTAEGSPPGPGYVSSDGHHFACKNPVLLQAAFHVIFAIDTSGSMWSSDRRPLPNAPGTNRIIPTSNNRLGAVVASLYSFWIARQAAVSQNAQLGGRRRDAYSLIFFSDNPLTCLENDFTSSPDELLTSSLRYRPGGNENYVLALQKAQSIMTSHWSTERTPVLIFLSDGEHACGDEAMYDICRSAVRQGMPLSFHAVSFGNDVYSGKLRTMAKIAQEVEKSAPRNSLTNSIPSSYTEALDTIRLTETFQGFANSLTKTRGSLLSSS